MRSLLQEIPENAADLAHLGHLHTPSMTSGVDLRYINSKTWEFLRHDWKVYIKRICSGAHLSVYPFSLPGSHEMRVPSKVRWEPEPEPNQHCSQMFVNHSLTVFGLHFSLLDVHVVARQVKLSVKHSAPELMYKL